MSKPDGDKRPIWTQPGQLLRTLVGAKALARRRERREEEGRAALDDWRAFLAPARRDLTDPNLPRVKDEPKPEPAPDAKPVYDAGLDPATFGRIRDDLGLRRAVLQTWAVGPTKALPEWTLSAATPTALVTRKAVPAEEIATHGCTDGGQSYLWWKSPTAGYRPRHAAPERVVTPSRKPRNDQPRAALVGEDRRPTPARDGRTLQPAGIGCRPDDGRARLRPVPAGRRSRARPARRGR